MTLEQKLIKKKSWEFVWGKVLADGFWFFDGYEITTYFLKISENAEKREFDLKVERKFYHSEIVLWIAFFELLIILIFLTISRTIFQKTKIK